MHQSPDIDLSPNLSPKLSPSSGPPGRPLGRIGPGSQPQAPGDAELHDLDMPGPAARYAPPLLPELDALAGCAAGLSTLRALLDVLGSFRVGSAPRAIDLSSLPDADRRLVCDSLGEGEVSIRFEPAVSTAEQDRATTTEPMSAQETRLAGVWLVRAGPVTSTPVAGRVRGELLEVADIPGFVRKRALPGATASLRLPPELPAGVMNAPGVLVEALEHLARRAAEPQAMAQVINLSLLPQTEQDLAFLDAQLGRGPLEILSRGYGNCRITATGCKDLWWVRYFNSDDRLILNTLECTDVPAAALAAQEDIDDSAERLGEILRALGEAAEATGVRG